jgi:two-component system sensor kinase FixL
VQELEHRVTRDQAESDLLRELRGTLEDLAAAEAALRDCDTRTRAIVDTAVDGIVTIDERGTIQSFNPAAERIFGYRAAEVIGKNVQLLMPAPDRNRHDAYLARYLETGEKRIIGIGREVVGQRKDGSLFPMDLAVAESFLDSGRVFTGMVRDLTARKRAEAELRELHKLAQQRERLADIGAITAQLAHDIGNPLAGVSMQAQLILRRAQRDPHQSLATVTNAAEQIVAQVGHLDRLTKDLMSFAREQRLELATIDPRHFFQDLADFWRPIAGERHVAVTLTVTAPVGEISADQDKLRRVFDNLVKNALEAINQSSGAIHITLVPESEKLRVSVADSGSGIPETVEIFRLFETTKPHGTGLGLAIARQIITAHGGQIYCARGQPRGTIFTVELPLKGAHV